MTLAEAFALLENISDDFTLEDLSDLANSFSVEDKIAIEGAMDLMSMNDISIYRTDQQGTIIAVSDFRDLFIEMFSMKVD